MSKRTFGGKWRKLASAAHSSPFCKLWIHTFAFGFTSILLCYWMYFKAFLRDEGPTLFIKLRFPYSSIVWPSICNILLLLYFRISEKICSWKSEITIKKKGEEKHISSMTVKYTGSNGGKKAFLRLDVLIFQETLAQSNNTVASWGIL